MSSTTTVAKPTQLRHRAPGGSTEATVTDEGRRTDKLLDSHTRQVLPLFSLAATEPVDKMGVWRSMGRDRDSLHIMSRAAKATLVASIVVSSLTVWGVHYIQQQEHEVRAFVHAHRPY